MHVIQSLSLQKWGNGTGIRTPKKVVKAADLHINQQFTITLQDDAILLTPIVKRDKLSLESLLEGVTPEMVGGELDWGRRRH